MPTGAHLCDAPFFTVIGAHRALTVDKVDGVDTVDAEEVRLFDDVFWP